MLNRLFILLIGIAFVGCGDSRINLDTLPKQEIEWVELDTDVKEKLIEGEEQIYLVDIPMAKTSFTNTSVVGLKKGDIEFCIGETCFWYEYGSGPIPPFVIKGSDIYYLFDVIGDGPPMFRDEEALSEFIVIKVDASNHLGNLNF